MDDSWGENHKKLLGSWEGLGRIEPNPWGSSGAITARLAFRTGPGGHSVIYDYCDKREDHSSFEGHGVLMTDPATNEVLSFWFDSHGAPPLIPSRGNWQNAVLTLGRTTPRGTNRTSFEPSPEGLIYRIEVCLPHEREFSPLVVIEFARTISPPSAQQ